MILNTSLKKDNDNISISKIKFELNNNYIIIFNTLFEKINIIVKKNKIYVYYKNNFEFDI